LGQKTLGLAANLGGAVAALFFLVDVRILPQYRKIFTGLVPMVIGAAFFTMMSLGQGRGFSWTSCAEACHRSSIYRGPGEAAPTKMRGTPSF
jgi:hypothetical protein